MAAGFNAHSSKNQADKQKSKKKMKKMCFFLDKTPSHH